MAATKPVRKVLTGLLNAGATLSVGFLAFAGMFVMTSSFIWCSAAFVLAAAYESQINGEGIGIALKRIFDRDYSALQILTRRANLAAIEYEDKKSKNPDATPDCNFPLIEDYIKQVDYIKKLKAQIKALKKNQHGFFAKLKMLFVYPPEIEAIREKKRKAKALMQEALLSLLYSNSSPLKKTPKLLTSIQQEIRVRKLWLRAGWFIAIATGISSGLATLGSMGAAIAVFPVLAAIPPLALIAVAAVAGAGYLFLVYQSLSDMLHDDRGTWKHLFNRRLENDKPESRVTFGLRIAGSVIAIALAIFTTIATAGTWWCAMKDGAVIASLSQKITDAIRWITLPLMTLGTLIFNSQNSVESINDVIKSQYTKGFNKIKKSFEKTRGNPFLIAERIVDLIEKPLVFLLHIASIGLMSDRVFGIQPEVSATLCAATEGLTDLNYLPNTDRHHGHDKTSHPHTTACADGHAGHHHHGHSHGGHQHNHGESLVLSMLFFPFTVTKTLLKGLGVLLDYGVSLFGSAPSWKKSYESVFPPTKDTAIPDANKPELSEPWKKLPVALACSDIIQRLKDHAPDKVNAARAIQEDLASDAPLSFEKLKENTGPLTRNRNTFWEKKPTRSEARMNRAFDFYKQATPLTDTPTPSP